MSNIYIVQLRNEFQEISENRMSKIGDYINTFDSTYLLDTALSAKEIYEHLTIENEFNIFIIKCEIDQYYGYLNKKIWVWINDRK